MTTKSDTLRQIASELELEAMREDNLTKKLAKAQTLFKDVQQFFVDLSLPSYDKRLRMDKLYRRIEEWMSDL